MRAIADKIRSALGETLVETLVAVMLCGVAAALLMSSLGTASSLNQFARATTHLEQQQAKNAARYSGFLKDGVEEPSSTGTVTFTDKDDHALTETFEGEGGVEVYGGSQIASWRLSGVSEG